MNSEAAVRSPFTAILAAAGGVALYLEWFHASARWPVYLAAGLCLLALLAVAAGYKAMATRPRAASCLLNAVTVGGLAIGCLLTFVGIRAGVEIRASLDHLPKPENDTLTESLTGVLAALLGWAGLAALGNRRSWLFPRRHVQAAFSRAFSRRWASGTRAADAIFEENVTGGDPVIRGWGWHARLQRARIIASALADDGTKPYTT